MVSSIIKYPKCIPIIKHPVCIVSISHHLISSFYIILYRKDFIIWYRITIILSLQKKNILFSISERIFFNICWRSANQSPGRQDWWSPQWIQYPYWAVSTDGVSIMKINHRKKKKRYICSLSLRYTIPDYFQKRSSNFLFICWCCCLLISPSPMQPRPKCNRWDRRSSMGTKNCWLVVWNIFIFPYIWE